VPVVALRVQTPTTELTLPGDRAAVVGRSAEVDIVVSHPKVSRRHVALEPHPTGWVARDLSTNGIWCEGRQVGTVPIGAETITLRLGAAQGPELTLTALATVETLPAEPEVDEAETRLAPGSGPVARPARVPAGEAGQLPTGETGRVPAGSLGRHPQPSGLVPAQGGPSPDTEPLATPEPGASAWQPPRWLTSMPTLVWLFAAAFAIGALVALS